MMQAVAPSGILEMPALRARSTFIEALIRLALSVHFSHDIIAIVLVEWYSRPLAESQMVNQLLAIPVKDTTY